jgi:prepilin-type N-terminal cleavage/methylation domain-containing protein
MKHKAFTLLEILIAIIIVGIIAGIILLNGGAGTSKAEQAACLGNRESLEHAYSLYKMGMANTMSLENFIKTDDKEALRYMDRIGKCPSGGIYSVSQDTATGRYHVVCSIHKDVIVASSGGGSGGSGTGDYIPGTNVKVNSTWSAEELAALLDGDSENTKLIKAGSTFKIGDNYYFALADVTLHKNWGNHQYGIESSSMWYNAGAIQKIITSSVIALTGTGSVTIQRGSLVSWNGSYYVAKNPTGWFSTDMISSSFIKLSSTAP